MRDITHCTAEECQSFTGCFRALSPHVKQAIARTGDLVSIFHDPRELDCYVPPAPDQRPEEVAVS